jgi:hypothetical protein
MKKIGIFFTERQHTLLKKEKKKTGCSIGSIVRNLIEEHFKKQKGRKSS